MLDVSAQLKAISEAINVAWNSSILLTACRSSQTIPHTPEGKQSETCLQMNLALTKIISIKKFADNFTKKTLT
jgi:hypothetical protein